MNNENKLKFNDIVWIEEPGSVAWGDETRELHREEMKVIGNYIGPAKITFIAPGYIFWGKHCWTIRIPIYPNKIYYIEDSIAESLKIMVNNNENK